MKKLILILSLLILGNLSMAQDPERFNEEIAKLSLKKAQSDMDLLLFVGSSSFRFWKSLETDISDQEALNMGFGGSMMSDVMYHYNSLVAPYDARMIFVYEGDNDVALGQENKFILKQYKQFIKKVKKQNKQTDIILLSAKPSPLRWEYKEQYEELNTKMKKLSKKKHVYFLDVWEAMLLENGEVDPDLFIKDRLHMNDKGYEIWLKMVKDMINTVYG